GTTTVVESTPTRDHTERMLSFAGVEVARSARGVSVQGPAGPEPRSWIVPGDISAAMFFVVGASIVAGSDLTVSDVGLNPTRTKALEVLEAMGADIEIAESLQSAEAEPVGSVRVRASALHGLELGPDVVPAIIDELPAIAVAATQAEGVTVVTGAGELRVKESDRIDALTSGLRILGALVETSRDGFAISGPTPLVGGEVDPRRDHRMAMAFAIAGLVAGGKVRVRDWSSAEVSFPGFADVLASTQARRV
ncbi:MAG TPA: 3-phosphoshikimate 1-carboxyvinyltransferase, partial [Actinomycetota bacterium]|nr:3-phosphoshikimate 1-carboxyvinyltransferase [Actinomycetota bacterium]